MIVLYILLFVLFLSVLIMFHELGHLLTAKMFGVYCFEYSIGFGPKLFSFKRKGGETKYSIRAIPFGGFVSMYGESDSIPDDIEGEIDPKRSLLNIKKWKRVIVLAAGVIMNFLLAITMFFIYEVAFPTYTSRYAHVSVSKDSIAETNGLHNGDYVYAIASVSNDVSYVFYDEDAVLTYEDDTQETVYFGFSFENMTIKDTSLLSHTRVFRNKEYGELTILDFEDYTISQILSTATIPEDLNIRINGFVTAVSYNASEKKVFYQVSENFGETEEFMFFYSEYVNDEELSFLTNVPRGEEITIIGNISEVTQNRENVYKAIKIKAKNILYSRPNYKDGNLLSTNNNDKKLKNISFKTYIVDENNLIDKGSSYVDFNNVALSLSGSTYRLDENIGIRMQLDEARNDFGTAVKNTFVDFGDGSVIIFKALGSLLVSSESWKNIGGILAVGVTTTRVLQDYGFGQFLFYWALISVNLGIINLLPFPGLDGWQILVTVIEGITRKEIPPKVKGWVSAVGIAILFAFMILILIKDIIGLF